VRVPTLVVHRKDDLCLKVEEGRYVASLIPGAVFVELPGADHLPFVGDQEEILGCIEKFVDDLQHDLPHDRSLATVLAVRITRENGEAAGWDALHCEMQSCMTRFHAMAFNGCGPDVLAAFDGPARAVRAARAALSLAARAGFEAAAGLHTGECMTGSTDALRGGAVRVAQRIRDCAASGEVLVSGTVRDLVAGSGLEFEPRGRIEAAPLGEWQLLQWKDPSAL
jgi:hypothetical protein